MAMKNARRSLTTGMVGVWTAAAMLGSPGVVWSQCPAPGPVCLSYDRATLVFVADVMMVEPEAGPTRSGFATRIQFRILQKFKGALDDQVKLSLAPSSEEFSYMKGQRVLVYASPSGRLEDSWSTMCSRTREVALADNELSVLGALRDKREGGTIDWTVATRELLRAGKPPDIRVVLRRQGNVVSEIKTVGYRFHTGWLTPGTYMLSVHSSIPGLESQREVVVSRESGCISLGSVANQQPRRRDQPPE